MCSLCLYYNSHAQQKAKNNNIYIPKDEMEKKNERTYTQSLCLQLEGIIMLKIKFYYDREQIV